MGGHGGQERPAPLAHHREVEAERHERDREQHGHGVDDAEDKGRAEGGEHDADRAAQVTEEHAAEERLFDDGGPDGGHEEEDGHFEAGGLSDALKERVGGRGGLVPGHLRHDRLLNHEQHQREEHADEEQGEAREVAGDPRADLAEHAAAGVPSEVLSKSRETPAAREDIERDEREEPVGQERRGPDPVGVRAA